MSKQRRIPAIDYDGRKVPPNIRREAIKYARAGLIAAGVKKAPQPPKPTVCANCGQRFGTTRNYKRHAETSWCSRHTMKTMMAYQRPVKGTIDPMRPELGKVPKGTLLYAALNGARLRMKK